VTEPLDSDGLSAGLKSRRVTAGMLDLRSADEIE
jgi:hypothetical protein